MWTREQKAIAIGLGIVGALALVGLTSTCFGTCEAAANSGHGPLQVPVSGNCPVPSGGTIDICAIVSANTLHCPISLPDLNPVDWLTWLSCALVSDAALIWNTVSAQVGDLIVTVFQGLFTLLGAGVTSVLNAILGAVQGVANAIVSTIQGISTWVSSVAANLGPLGPLFVVVFTGSVIAGGAILAYFLIIGLFAVGKSLWNLL